MSLIRALAQVQEEITLARSTNQDFESVIKPLYDEQTAIIKHNRDQYEDENYFTWIDCPEHITHKVKLFTYGHRYAGVWECDESGEGISDSCPHYDREIEQATNHDGDDFPVYVCALCRVDLEGDPREDEVLDCD